MNDVVLLAGIWLALSTGSGLLYAWVKLRRHRWTALVDEPAIPASLTVVRTVRLPYRVQMRTSSPLPIPISQHATPREAVQGLEIVAKNFKANGWALSRVNDTAYEMALPCDWGFSVSVLEVTHESALFTDQRPNELHRLTELHTLN